MPRHGPAHMQAHTCTRALCHPGFPIQGLCKHHSGTQSLVITRGAWISAHICKLLWNREEAETRPSSYRQQGDVTRCTRVQGKSQLSYLARSICLVTPPSDKMRMITRVLLALSWPSPWHCNLKGITISRAGGGSGFPKFCTSLPETLTQTQRGPVPSECFF